MKGNKPIWNLYKKGKLLGKYTTLDISKITGMKINNVSDYAETGFLYKGIYQIERAKKEWDEVTEKLIGRFKE